MNHHHNQDMTRKLHTSSVKTTFFSSSERHFTKKNTFSSTSRLSHGRSLEWPLNTPPKNLLVMDYNFSAEDLNCKAFMLPHQGNSTFMCALASLVNSDKKYVTSSVKRLVYPHMYNHPCTSPINRYHVKLIVNGIRRCFLVHGTVDWTFVYSWKHEVYPFLIYKAMTVIYPEEDLHRIRPNLLLYRMSGWLPETLHYSEIGDLFSCFQKLFKNLNSFNIIISFDYKDEILPIFDLIFDENTKRRFVVTLKTKAPNPDHVNREIGKTITARPAGNGEETNSANRKKGKRDGGVDESCPFGLGPRVPGAVPEQLLYQLESFG